MLSTAIVIMVVGEGILVLMFVDTSAKQKVLASYLS